MSRVRAWSRGGGLGAATAVAVLTSACALVEPSPPADPTREMLPARPVPEAMLEPLGNALVIRVYSGEFTDHADRELLGSPDIVVFDDGLVIAAEQPPFEPDPTYVGLQLDPDELEQVRESLLAADLDNLAAGGQRDRSFCIDCPTAIIRTDISGETIEVAAAGLLTTLTPEYVAQLPYPPEVIAVDRLLNELRDRVRDEGAPYSEPVPLIPIAPCMCG